MKNFELGQSAEDLADEILRASQVKRFQLNGESPEAFVDLILREFHLGDQHDQSTHGNRGGELAEKAVKEGGFTYNPVRLKGRAPREGFAVSMRKDTEEVFDIKEGRAAIKQRIIDYVKKHREAIKARGNFLGGWYDDQSKKVFLDISTVVDDLPEAERIARENGQLAVYDLKAGKVIDVLRKKAA